jgi:CheY-like chemotaxis protein
LARKLFIDKRMIAPRVLVIDDVPDVLMLATLSLEAVGCVALTAHDGLEGVEVANTQWPDLILCDVHMPRLDGFELLSAIRANVATAAIPVVFVTGDQSVSSRLHQLSAQPNALLAKPFTHAELVRTVTANIPQE